MRLYARQGRRNAALAHYQVCVSALHRELGVEPEEATKQLYREILSARAAPGAALAELGGTTDVEPAADETPLVGRTSELALLAAGFRRAMGGHGGVLTVLGEAGIGKTRLVREAVAGATRDGARVLLGRAYESHQGFPFSPWTDALRAGGVVDEVRDDAGAQRWRAELARLFPELGGGEPIALLGAESAAKLFEAFAQVLIGLSRRSPLILVLEDLQWADEMSLRLLPSIARRIADRRAMVIATARGEEVAASPALRKALAELGREPSHVTLSLGPLSQDDTLSLVRLIAGGAPGRGAIERLGDAVWRASEGHPLSVVEMSRVVPSGDAAAAGALPLPPRVADAIADRLDRLSEPARRLVDVAAVIGRRFDFELLRRAAGLSAEDAALGVEALVARHILRVLADDLDVTHDRVREVALARVLPPRRRLLHEAVGEAIETLHAGRLDEVTDRLARHFSQSDRADKAVRYLVRAGERAATAYAYADAAAALGEALRQAERLPAEERDRTRLDLAMRRAYSLSFLGRWSEIVDLLAPHRAHAERGGDPALSSAWFFRMGMCHFYLGRHPEAARDGGRALETARKTGDLAAAGRAHYLLALSGYHTGDFAESAEHGRQAIAALGAAEERLWFGGALWILALDLTVLGEFDAALAAADRLQRLAETTDEPRLRSFAAYIAGWTRAARGDVGAGLDSLEQAVRVARDPLATALASGRLGWAHAEAGDVDQAAAHLERAIALLDQLKFRSVQAQYTAFLADVRLREGNAEAAAALAEQTLAMAVEVGHRYSEAAARAALGRIALATGDPDDARRLLGAAAERYREMGARPDLARTQLDLASAAERSGAPDEARAHRVEAHAAFSALGVARRAD